jgi:hypothetical protein
LVENSFVFINFFSKIVFGQKKALTLKTETVASSGGQRKVTHFMYFPWPPLEAGLLI